MSVICQGKRLTCTVPGNVPGQSCAGPRAAGTGTDQGRTAPPQLRRGPAEKRKPPINTTLSHCQILQRSIRGCRCPDCQESSYCIWKWCKNKFGNLTEAPIECCFSTFVLFLGNKVIFKSGAKHWPKHNPLGKSLSLFFHLLTYNRCLALNEDKRGGEKRKKKKKP